MNFEWDEAKRRSNARKHGLDFADAHLVFDGIMLYSIDLRKDYGEERWQGSGLFAGRVVVVVFTQPQPETIRNISFRKAKKHERVAFEEQISY